MNQCACPHCGQTYSFSPEQQQAYQGQQVRCTTCSQPFSMTPTGELKPGPIPVATAGPPPLPGYVQSPGQMGVPYGGPTGLYAPPKKSMGAGTILLIVFGAIALVGVIPLLIAILLPSLNRAREQANLAKCANNIRQISLACLLYSNANIAGDHQFPDTLNSLVTGPLAQDVTPNVMVCPATSDTPANPDWSNFNAGGHISYVYCGRGISGSSADANVVLVYEPLTINRNEGCNMGFADARVEFIRKGKAQRMISEINAGQNPPPSASQP